MGVNTELSVYPVKKYIKIPDRRLISGLLYVNVINHDDNNDKDDFMQQAFNTASLSDPIQYANAFTNGASAFALVDRKREDMKHSFADYDCFVFHVAGGMTLSGGIRTPIGATEITGVGPSASLVSEGYATGPVNGKYTWKDGGYLAGTDLTAIWYETPKDDLNPYGDYCSHFVKSHLISRINNASGHHPSVSDFNKHRPILNQEYSQSTLDNENTLPTTDVNRVLSNGTYATKDTVGEDLGLDSIAVLESGATDNTGYQKIDDDNMGTSLDGNTYFAPVDDIKIYGQHNIGIETHFDASTEAGATNKIWREKSHESTFWSLVIDIGIRGANGDNSTSYEESVSDIFQNRINISFQPFGETANFDIDDSLHT
jgi:hypothetical protein